VASILLSLDPFTGSHAALWLIGWRFLQAFGGSMLTANSPAILTDAFPKEQRGFALGVSQAAIFAGQFLGLTAGGLPAAAWDWRAVFWVNVPTGIAGTLWAYFRLQDKGVRRLGARIDRWGNVTFAARAAPNSSAVMSSVPAEYGGVASGMRATFQNSGTSVSIAVFSSLMIAGLASALPRTLTIGLARRGVTHHVAAQIGSIPPVSSLFAALLGVNPVHYLLSRYGALSPLTPANRNLLTGRDRRDRLPHPRQQASGRNRGRCDPGCRSPVLTASLHP
jgi:MFS family permease